MNWDIIAMAFFRMALLLAFFLLLAYSAVQLLRRRLSRRYGSAELNGSGAIVIAGILGTIGLFVNEISGAAISTVKFLLKDLDAQQLILAVGKYLIVFLVIAVAALITTFLVNVYLFKITTKKKVLTIIDENRVPDAFYFAVSLIIIGWLTSGGVGALLDGFVPYPAFPSLN